MLVNYYIINSVIFFYTFRCLECEGEFCNECHTGENQQNHLVTPALGLPVILSGNSFLDENNQIITRCKFDTFVSYVFVTYEKDMIMALQETLNIYMCN